MIAAYVSFTNKPILIIKDKAFQVNYALVSGLSRCLGIGTMACNSSGMLFLWEIN